MSNNYNLLVKSIGIGFYLVSLYDIKKHQIHPSFSPKRDPLIINKNFRKPNQTINNSKLLSKKKIFLKI